VRQRQSKLVSESADELVIENFRWGRIDVGDPRLAFDFQRTTVRPGRIADVYYWSENFPPKWLAAHGQLVFVMEGDEGVVGDDGRGDLGMVFSVEAHLREGQSYSPLRGLLPDGEYGVIHMLTTMSDRIQRSALIYGHSMDAFRLRLSDDQKQELARIAIRTASKPRPEERYHTTRNSCVTETIRVINQVVPEEEQIPLWTVPGVLANLRVSHPKWTPGLLVDRGLAEAWQSWDETIRELEIPQRRGPDRHFDVLALPGSGVPRGARALENALHQYVQGAHSYRELEAVLASLPDDAPRREAHQAELDAAAGTLGEALEALTELTVADPPVTVPYLLRQERPDTPQAARLIRALVGRLRGEVSAGRWTPTPEQEEAMGELGAPGG
jgi:hypothetical protein